ncbi:MAG: hypothetical protein BGO23_02860 [Solirubrobacterales bacterium 67-14]|nr:MAG: hypothetical protein BGO23_02860 [Solirubrobacterales bacterium 67-14]
MGLRGAVHSLTRPTGKARLSGPTPVDQNGLAIAPADAAGHDHLWWLDRMVRSDQQLVERMALIFHDWFATLGPKVANQRLMLDQSNLFRGNCFGSFLTLFTRVTVNPAMLITLDGQKNRRGRPNENYAREMMELFSLGARRGYTEGDVRQMARALTGWTNRYSDQLGVYDFHFEPKLHDFGRKVVFGKAGKWGWRDAPRLCVQNPKHPSFFVKKLWSYFVSRPPKKATRQRLERIYRKSGWKIRPVVEAILLSPEFYEDDPMVKPPAVYLASMLRARRRGIDTTAWVRLCERAGQRLFNPPDVAGWDDSHWLDTARMQARWEMTNAVIRPAVAALARPYPPTETTGVAVEKAIASWNNPDLEQGELDEMADFAERTAALANQPGEYSNFRRLRQAGLQQLVGVSSGMVMM